MSENQEETLGNFQVSVVDGNANAKSNETVFYANVKAECTMEKYPERNGIGNIVLILNFFFPSAFSLRASYELKRLCRKNNDILVFRPCRLYCFHVFKLETNVRCIGRNEN